MNTVTVKNGPARRNYAPYKGDTFTDGFTITLNGVAADLSGDTFKMRIRDAKTGVPAHTLEIGSGIEVDSNSVVFRIEPADMEALPIKKYKYDIQWTKADGTVKTLLAGIIEPESDVTPP